MLKRLAKKALGEKNLGRIEYHRRPELRKSWGGPFNDQSFRQKIFRDLVAECNFDTIVETGTFRGTTTEYMAGQFSGTILTVEFSVRQFGYVSARLGGNNKVHLFNNDSRAFLREIGSSKHIEDRRVLYYLDAHWGADLPLREEVEIIFANSSNAVIMIDDFHVPDDEGYTYDDYGSGKALTLEYLQPVFAQYPSSIYFPSAPSSEESGYKRGSVVISKEPNLVQTLNAIPSLRVWNQINA